MTDDVTTLQRERDVTERLDERDLLDVAHGPGTYALRVDVPSMPSVAREEWLEVHDTTPADDVFDELASAPAVAYVGASSNVYERLSDHVGTDVRKASFLEAYDPVSIVNVWPYDDPFEAEYNTAARLARSGWTVWQDGEIL